MYEVELLINFKELEIMLREEGVLYFNIHT